MSPRSPALPFTRADRDAGRAADVRAGAILLAAERLFARHGYHAVSIRQIADEAGVPLALVGYYYGAKHELFRAIFVHWRDAFDPKAVGIADVLATRRSASPRRALAAVITALVQPLLALRASADGEHCARLVARLLSQESDETDAVLREFFDPLAKAYVRALREALPGATRAQATWCYQFSVGALAQHLNEPRRARGEPSADLLVDFIVGGVLSALGR